MKHSEGTLNSLIVSGVACDQLEPVLQCGRSDHWVCSSDGLPEPFKLALNLTG